MYPMLSLSPCSRSVNVPYDACNSVPSSFAIRLSQIDHCLYGIYKLTIML